MESLNPANSPLLFRGSFMMLKAIVCFSLLLQLSPAFARQDQAVTASPTIHIYTDQPTAHLGSPIIVKVELLNTTKQPFFAFQAPGGEQGDRYYSVFAVDTKGRAVEKTAYGKRLETGTPIYISRIQRTINPGSSLIDTIDFSLRFKFTQSGTYQLQVERLDPLDPSGKRKLKSNLYQVTVSPSQKQ